MSSSVAASPAMIAAGSPGREVEQREDDERDHRHDDDGRDEPPDDIGEHLVCDPGVRRRDRSADERHFFSTFQRNVTGAMITPGDVRAVRGRQDELRRSE